MLIPFPEKWGKLFVPGNEVDVCPRPSIRPRRDITDRVTFLGQTDWVALAIHQVAANELRSHEGTPQYQWGALARKIHLHLPKLGKAWVREGAGVAYVHHYGHNDEWATSSYCPNQHVAGNKSKHGFSPLPSYKNDNISTPLACLRHSTRANQTGWKSTPTQPGLKLA